MKSFVFALAALFALTAAALPDPAAFSVKLAGVAAIGMNESPRFAKPQLPDLRLHVSPGQVALFLIEYTLPPGIQSRLFLTANGRLPDGTELPFGYSGSTPHSGTGRLIPVLFLPPEAGDKAFLLQSVRIEGEILAEKNAPRNKPFFLCDIPVEVLFSKEPAPEAASVIPLEPQPAPPRDPALGIVTVEEIPFMSL